MDGTSSLDLVVSSEFRFGFWGLPGAHFNGLTRIPKRLTGTRCINTQLGHQLIAGSVQLMEQPWMAQAHL